ncbi:threonine--tRNA ligase [Oenococcus kitaharae]|uniref:Threonine--tRNA ligase n=1 Tax=Oenococcus kitaharae DSM 17330 TaxID=1045004 RepID=G9WIH2_9LACO|nr:threonine--tRNA ligase [Oenococcus kitaharae]EHN58984.1 Threonyl-tRNA synthetase [Oenococcus kitaharae DSM 17330]OEY81707.1 threonyl-tRNA synthase [Oenococcus kitaharae]OEY83938.1 threonyl-tRNA synthase [Oenococcus kitaharae]OEY85706.1 threonyl-tRNA synthase [Oenococcus kitaharae]
MADFKLTMPDGSIKDINQETTPMQIAQAISPSLAKKSVAARVDKHYVGMNEAIRFSGQFKLVTKDEDEALDILRHSTAHLLAQALRHLHPKIHLGVGPSISNGFYYDTDDSGESDKQVAADEFPAIEAEMAKIVKADLPINNRPVSRQEALQIFADDPYKVELINDLPEDEEITIAVQGDYTDLDRGGLVPSTGCIKHFALSSVAGAYWRGKSDNPMMQRIYGLSEWTAEDLQAQQTAITERKERDHRTIGRQMELFFTNQEIGAGLPVWLPNGAAIRRTIEDYVAEKERENGYLHVYTPVVSNLDLYKRSGHWDHYRDDMFPPMKADDGEELELRPMNCPSHIEVFEHEPRSYRDLPYRIAEFGQMHRWEKSGALTGLSRVREMTLNDGHTVVAPEQVESEFKEILRLIREVYADFGFTDKDYRFRLSYRDPKNTKKYYDDDAMWEHAQAALKRAMDDMHLDYFEAEGEAAFYGPKLDIQFRTALGNEETMSTIQLDFLLPERFDMKYTGEDGQDHRPVLIHRGVVGTMERFVAFLIEKYKGQFPTWLAPVQAVIIPVNYGAHGDYAQSIYSRLMKDGRRIKFDKRDEKLGYLIRDAQVSLKTPYILVVGDQEVQNGTVTVRLRGSDKTQEMSVDEFEKLINSDVANYSKGSEKVQEMLSK